MIKRVKLPMLTDLLNIFSSDPEERDDVGRVIVQPVDPGGGGFTYCYCSCYCMNDYRDGMFYSWFWDVGG